MSSVTITFKSVSKENDNIVIELDEEKNSGKTEFVYGEKAYFKVFFDPNSTVYVSSTDGTITNEGQGTEAETETFYFIDSKEATTRKPCLSISSFRWFGNSLGHISVKGINTIVAEKDPELYRIGLAEVNYITNFKRFAVSIPQKNESEYPVLIVVYGQ